MTMCTKEEKEKCIGCSQYDPEYHDDSPCERPGEYEGYTCPCIDCVIKMICEDGCKPYEDYHQYVIKRQDQEKGWYE